MRYYITDYHNTGAGAVALEDSIMHKGRPVTAGSAMLAHFTAPITATVAHRLLAHAYTIAGKTTMDAFGVLNLAPGRPAALSGAVQAVADGAAGYALCNDIFGRYRQEAAENGLCYIHPTYGTVSRYGLIPLASSMDQIGIVCRGIADGLTLLSHIAGHDANDGAMFPAPGYAFAKPDRRLTIGVPRSLVAQASPEAQSAIEAFLRGFDTTDAELPYFDVYKQVMYILSCAEISNNITRYDGIKFGYRAPAFDGLSDLYTNTRTEGFTPQVKLTALMGAMVLSQEWYVPYYEKAMKLRRLIRDSLCFDRYDLLLLPCRIGEEPYENLSLYAPAPLAGLPSVSFSFRGQGLQLLANVKNERLFFGAQEVCEA